MIQQCVPEPLTTNRGSNPIKHFIQQFVPFWQCIIGISIPYELKILPNPYELSRLVVSISFRVGNTDKLIRPHLGFRKNPHKTINRGRGEVRSSKTGLVSFEFPQRKLITNSVTLLNQMYVRILPIVSSELGTRNIRMN